MRKCAKCGARNDDQAVMCSLCNERLGVNSDSTSYEPRLWNQGKQTFRGKGPSGDPNATRDEPPLGRIERELPLGKPLSGTHDAAKAAQYLADSNTTRHYLVPQLGEPMLLDSAKGSAVFGRDEGCEFRLASTKVSRRHAELLFSKADKVYVRDLSSQNGTFVNGEKLSGERALEDGDELRVADFSVTYRKLPPGADPAQLTLKANETAVMEAVRIDAIDDGALTGDVSILPVGEVLRRLGSIRAHGALNLDVGGNKGFILLVDGKPVNGAYAGLEGAPAVTAMASLTKGHFSFVFDPNAPRPVAPPPSSATPRQPAPAVRPPGPTPGPAPARPAPGAAHPGAAHPGGQAPHAPPHPAHPAPPRRPSPPPPG